MAKRMPVLVFPSAADLEALPDEYLALCDDVCMDDEGKVWLEIDDATASTLPELQGFVLLPKLERFARADPSTCPRP